MNRRVIIVGGGLAGLSTAFFLQRARPDLSLTLLEKETHTGGKVRSSLTDGFTVDWAANGFLPNVPETLELSKLLGLKDELQEASEIARHRFLYRGGALKRLPTSPPAFIASPLLLPSEKLRAAGEPLLGRAREGEESVYAFIARHFGRGVADAFAEPFVLGITAGDAKRLSLDALFPRFRALEQAHGSLVRGMIAQQRAAKSHTAPGTPKRLTSFTTGSGRLVEALEKQFRGRLERNAAVRQVQPRSQGFEVAWDGGNAEAEAVVLATPAFVTARLLTFAPEGAEALAAIPYADVQVIGLGFHRIDVPNPLDGFGFLVPRGEGVRVLGVLYSSSIFPGQAPEGQVLLRVIAGGTVDPEFATFSPDEALEAVRRDLRVTMGVTAEPTFVQHIPWERGIPQYELGHGQRVSAAFRALERTPGLVLTGNAYHGVGVNDTVRDAKRAADAVLTQLAVR